MTERPLKAPAHECLVHRDTQIQIGGQSWWGECCVRAMLVQATIPRMMTRLEMTRRKLGWNQTTLAAKVHSTQAKISRFERGSERPSPDYVRRLASILEIPEAQLMEVVRSDVVEGRK